MALNMCDDMVGETAGYSRRGINNTNNVLKNQKNYKTEIRLR